MLPLAVSVFITQIIAFLGVAAVAKVVVLFAYHFKDIDIRFMYHENIFRHLGWYKDYNTLDLRRILVIYVSLLALVISFIPTYLSFGADTLDAENVAYTNIQTSTNSKRDLRPGTISSTKEPLFKEFYDTSKHTPANSTGIILENYILSTGKKTQMNPSGVWYNVPSVHFLPEQQIERWKKDVSYLMQPQNVNDQGVFSTQDSNSTSFAILYNNKDKTEGSSTLESCVDNDPLKSNLVTNMTSIDGHRVQGVVTVNRTCYPMTDPSLWLVSSEEQNKDMSDSILNYNQDNYFRSASPLNHQSSASYSMGVVTTTWDNSYTTVVMIKKSAHITIFYNDVNRAITPDSCISSSFADKSTFHQDINMIACQLVSQAKQNPTLPMLQATRRLYEGSKMINSVYTYIRRNGGHGIMVDLTLYSAFSTSIAGSGIYDKEIPIAYQQLKKSNFDTMDFEQLLQSINPFPDIDTEYGLNTIADLVYIGTKLLGMYFSRDFLKTTASIIPFVRVSTVWIGLTVSLAVVFIVVIIASTVMAPEAYETDLRSLLVHTLITQESAVDNNDNTTLNRKEKTGLSMRAVCLDGKKGLKMDGNPIILSENIPMVGQTANNAV
ncbi:hypothetical protein PS15p_201134 [Mucor circinelloides]